MDRNELFKEIIKKGLVKPYDFIDPTYFNARVKEVEKGTLHKQMTGNIAPCIKTNIHNYGVVVYED